MPFRDRREEILVRLETVVLPSVVMSPSIAHVARNAVGIPDEKRPAIILLDADETGILQHKHPDPRVGMAPQLVTMAPEIFYLAGDLPENQVPGTHLNLAKCRIMDAIVSDVGLREICGRNGYIGFGGMETDMKTGSTVAGEALLHPVFTYPFIPSELKQE
jgi:hypothetical protein